MKKVTLDDIAKRAGVTPATVSMIINGKTSFKDETIQKVMTAMRELNYIPNVTNKRFSRKATKTVAFFVYDIKSGFEIEILRGIQKIAIINGYDILFLSKRAYYESYGNIIKNLILGGKVDGIISVYFDVPDELLSIIENFSFPFVMIENNKNLVDSIEVDNFNGGYQAGKYLHKVGRDRVAIISATYDDPTMKDRVAGFVKAAKEFGNDIKEEDIILIRYGDFDFLETGKKIVETLKLEGKLEKYNAFFVPAGDEVAIGIMQSLFEYGYKVPDDFGIIGFDDVPISKFIYPSLTTIRQDLNKMGEIAMKIILDRITKFKENKNVKFNRIVEKIRTELVVRDSV